MLVKAVAVGDQSWDRACLVCGYVNELHAASAPSPAEIRWALFENGNKQKALFHLVPSPCKGAFRCLE